MQRVGKVSLSNTDCKLKGYTCGEGAGVLGIEV